MNRLPAGYKNLRPLADAFGGSAFRGPSSMDDGPVFLLGFPLGQDLSFRADRCGTLARRWETLAVSHPILVPPIRWFLDGQDFFLVYRDPGGPLLADLVDNPGGIFGWERYLFPFLDQWEKLEQAGSTWTALDLRRMVMGPQGPQSFDFLHLSAPPGGESWVPPLATSDDLLYISPELTRRTSWPVDVRSGLYSFGGFMYRVASGGWPLAKTDPLEMVHALLNQPANLGTPKIRALGAGLQAILKKLLSKDPKDRYQTIRGLRWDLGRRALAPDQHMILGSRDRLLPVADVEGTCGRQAEKQFLAEVVRRLKVGLPSALVFRGGQGLGKSRLVEDLRILADAEGILWLPGRFDQFDKRFSSGGVAQALGTWAESFGSRGPGAPEPLVSAVRSAVGRQARGIGSLLPALAPYLDPGTEAPVLGPEEQQRRFLETLVTLVRIGSEVRPLVLAFEELHWADDLSLQFLETLLENLPPGLALVATCRPQRTGGPGLLLERFLRGPGPGPGVVDLAPLGEEEVLDLVARSTDLESDDRRQLARILVRHSAGNPFNLRILLREVNVRQAAVFDELDGKWRLLPGKLRNLPFDGAVDLILDRIRDLDPGVRQALLVSSLLGVQFTKAEVTAAGPLSPEFFDLLAEEFLDLGIWESLGLDEFRFTHDKLQQAVYEMADEGARTAAHLRIGRDRLDRWRWGAVIAPASVAVHLNFSPGALTETEMTDLVDLNIRAAKDVREAGDSKAALEFYQMAVTLGAENLWDRDPDRAWDLHKTAAEAAYAEDRRDLAEQWCEEAVSRCRFPAQRAQIRERQQTYRYLLGDPDGSIQAGIQGLRELGIRIPGRPGAIRILGSFGLLKALLAGRKAETLVHRPESQDPRSRTALHLLAGFIPPAILGGRTRLFALAAFRAVRRTLQGGLCPESSPAYAALAALLSALGDLKGAREFGKLAVAVNRRFDDPVWRPLVLTLTSLFCFGWFEPRDQLRSRFEEALKAAEQAGDLLSLTFTQLLSSLWNQGEDLPTRIRNMEYALGSIAETRFSPARSLAGFVLGRLRCLRTPELPTAGGASVPSDQDLEAYEKQGSKAGRAVCHGAILQSAFLLGDLDRAQEALSRVQALRPAVAGSLFEEELTLYSGLVCADLARRLNRSAGRRLDAFARQARKWTRQSRSFGCVSWLLDAEKADLSSHIARAQRFFFLAMEEADRLGNLLLMALVRERSGLFHRRRDFPGVARQLFEGSLDYWRRYGALAKVALLEAETGLTATTVGVPPGGTSDSWDFDFVSLVRALDAFSAEIRIDDLIRSVSKLVLENSGADRVSFFVAQEEGLTLEGESGYGGFRSGDHLPLDQASDLPRGLLKKTAQDRLPLVRETLTSQDHRQEPILSARGVKSLICLPLVAQGDLKALVYLENKVSPGILTKERIRTIERLSSTIGIALQNARLFDQVRQSNESLERRVEERTRELQASQKKIVLQEKLASLGALTAGIAHELKNPLNLITNFAESSMELMGELEGVLGPLMGTFPDRAREELAYLLPELVQNMRDLRVQGQRGDGIIRSMLQHSRADAGVPTIEDLGALVRESLALSYHGIRATQKDFRCQTEERFAPGVPPVRMIRPDFGRVLINLFTNAFQAVLDKQRRLGPDYQPLVTVSVEKEAGQIRLVVEDNGPGIPKELQEKIFQPFFTTKAPGEGTGLGLSISYEILQEELGGTLEVESQPGVYTRFIIKIPVGDKD